MDNKLQVFNNKRFGDVRTVEIDNKTHFVGIDIARALGYSNPNDAITRHCRGYVKHAVPTNSGIQQMNVIAEGDIYRLTAKSELAGAEEFESWIFDEVIPSIRKHGAYMTPETIEKILLNPDTIITLATNLKREMAKNRILIERNTELEPKAEVFNDLVNSEGYLTMAEAAKELNFKGMGPHNVFRVLWNLKVLFRSGMEKEVKWLPMQEHIERRRFVLKTKLIKKGSMIEQYQQIFVTPKGLAWLNLFLRNYGYEKLNETALSVLK